VNRRRATGQRAANAPRKGGGRSPQEPATSSLREEPPLYGAHPDARSGKPLASAVPPDGAKATSEPLRFVDLFCGIGGFRLAFERAGCQCVFSCDWDEHAQITYEANFGERPHGDIYSIPDNAIPPHHILCAGFPCQPFSIAGVSKKLSLGKKHGFEDKEQGNLFFKLAELIDHHRPDAFVLENVKHLQRHDQGRTFRIIWETLTDHLKYHVYHRVIDARGLVPQHRERIFLVGFREARYFEFPEFPTEGPKLESILEAEVPEKYTLTDHLWNYLQAYAAKHKAAGNGFGFGLVTGKDIARTLSARYYKDGSEILISQGPRKNPRRLTPRECARLMGFPEDFKIPVSDTQAYRQFGNSVVVPVVERIAKAVVATLQRRLGFRGELILEFAERHGASCVPEPKATTKPSKYKIRRKSK
jgi:DNA (cytosine-5)-methyltransferase 1